MQSRLNFYEAGPDAIKAMLGLEAHINKCGFEKPLIDLVRLRASQINGCSYCIDKHYSDARKLGETERRLATLAVWEETALFSGRERAALEWTEAVTEVAKTHVPDAVWERVKPHFTSKEMVDLTLLISTINAWNRIAIAFRKQPD